MLGVAFCSSYTVITSNYSLRRRLAITETKPSPLNSRATVEASGTGDTVTA